MKIRDKNGKWLDSSVFREEALKFLKTKTYCIDPKGTPAWREYWTEQLRRTKEGYEVEGQKITGHHYFYLNFTQIEIVEKIEGSKASKKTTSQPDFWDGDYDFFWCLEIALNGLFNPDSQVPSTEKERSDYTELQKKIAAFTREYGKGYEESPEYIALKEKRDKISQKVLDRLQLKVKPHLDWVDGGHHFIVGKARRKGYSYKNGSICTNIYNSVRKSLTLIGAFDKKYLYPEGTMGMSSNYMSFLNKYTAWAKAREYVDKQEHKRASFKEVREGIPTEAGYHSQVMALTFKDNPDAARGKDARIVLFEEAGKFPNLKDSFNATFPGLTAGSYVTGQIIIFGTGGDMESGTVDFAEMFYNPEQFNIMPFYNIWDENADQTTCGFFHPTTWNMEGYYDIQGNSDIVEATRYELEYRQKLLKTASSSEIVQKRVQEYPLCPSEAFLTVSTNDFPIIEIRQQLDRIKRDNLHLKKYQICDIFRDETGKVRLKPDLKSELEPIWEYRYKNTNIKGALCVVEAPIDNPPKGLYKIGYDPYRQVLGTSLGSIYVYKGNNKFSYTRDTIVAQYIGRPYSPDSMNRIAEMLAELYGAEIMHENEVTHVKGYFEKIKKLHLLAGQPDRVISTNIKNSTVARVYGMHMVDKLKDAGEKYIKQWLLTERDIDENGNKIYNLNTIYDPGLLEELIVYNRKGNFDRIMSFMMVLFQVEEDGGAEKEYKESNVMKSIQQEFENLNNVMFKK